MIWQGKVGNTPLRVGVAHAARILAEWDTPQGSRQKVSSSLEEFERAVLFQLLLGAGETDTSATDEIVKAVAQAQASKPRPAPSPERRRKNPKARLHRRSRTPPRRR